MRETFLERMIGWAESRKSGPLPAYDMTSEELRKSIAEANSAAGEKVSRITSVQVSTVAACARVISEGLAQVSCRLMREDDRGSLVAAREHPLFKLLNRKPNDWQTSMEFREQIGLHLALTGNAFVFINRVNGEVAELYAFQPEAVKIERADDLSLSYRISSKNRAEIRIPAADMWHLRGPSWNGYEGNDPISSARRTIGLALATETYGSKLFENGARPGVILTTRTGATPITNEQRADIKKMWGEQHQGAANAHKTVMLPFDLDVNTITSTANDAQWVESRKFLIEEVCRHFRVLPIMVMSSENSSYASVEQLFQAHLIHTLMPWFERFEQSADNALLTDKEIADGFRVKLNSTGLLRGSTAERTSYYNTMVSLGAMTVNEVREREDMALSDDPEADKLRAAANLFGDAAAPSKNDEVTK